MIEIALTSEQRRDSALRRKLDAWRPGDEQQFEQLHELLLPRIADDETRKYLKMSVHKWDPNAPGQLFEHLKSRMEKLAKECLYPSPDHPVDTAQVNREWGTLSIDAREAAERLWRDDFIRDATFAAMRRRLLKAHNPITDEEESTIIAQQGHLEQLARQSHQLMLLWVEISLFHLRAKSNVLAYGPMRARSRQSDIDKQIAAIVKGYRRTLRRWHREVRRATEQRVFGTQFGDAERLRELSKEFGPARVRDGEKGWVRIAQDASDELRYRYFDALLSEYWRSGWYVRSASHFIRKLTTGYGLKPARFAVTTFVAIVVFAALFFVNDYYNPGIRSSRHFCPGTSPGATSLYEEVLKYLYIAVTNLTSVGSVPSLGAYCGGNFTRILLIFAPLTGYFLLATLAALFFQQIREAER